MIFFARRSVSRQSIRGSCGRRPSSSSSLVNSTCFASAARLAQDCIRKVDVLEYPELGMEAIWKIEVEDFPAFIVIDDKGNDFFKELNLG